MQTTQRTIETVLQRLDEAIEAKKGADLPSTEERRRLRLAAGLSAREMATVLGVNPHTVYTWETKPSLPMNGNSRIYGAVLDRLAEVAK